jgi:hypothetical protein
VFDQENSNAHSLNHRTLDQHCSEWQEIGNKMLSREQFAPSAGRYVQLGTPLYENLELTHRMRRRGYLEMELLTNAHLGHLELFAMG